MWVDGLPNLVIGLREGLEIGLVVSILLAAVRRSDAARGTGPVWLGVLSAALLSLGFGAVLALSRAELTIIAQAVFGGVLSLVAVVLVTWMIFWMRRAARGLSGELRDKVGHALTVGSTALALTAFLAVAREGLETALFLWTTVQAAGDTIAPLAGAAVGLAVSTLLCWLIVRAGVRANLSVFFSRTAVLLIVIAAGVLAYGVGELQTAGLVPGRSWLAFDLSTVVSTDSWWVSLISGITNLSPRMTVLQVVLYLAYLAVVLVLFLRKPAAVADPVERPVRRLPRWAYATAAVAAPLLVVGVFALVTPSAEGASTQVTVTADGCATDWAGATAGSSTITVVNKSGHGGEIYLIRAADGGVVSEIESLGPGTRRSITVNLPAGQYSWRCLVPGELDQVSPVAAVTGASGESVPAVKPVSDKDLQGPADSFTAYIADKLATLDTQTGDLAARIGSGDLDGARAAWLPAQLTWERIGAAYGQFDDLGLAIDRLPQGLPQGVRDPDFTGLHRVEYGLWHGESAADLAPAATKLHQDVQALRQKLKFDPADLPLRAHEIMEDALRRHLNGVTDQGSNSTFALVGADVEATNAVLDRLAPLLDARKPGLVASARAQLAAVTAALTAGKAVVDARVGAVVETLANVPTLLEVRAS